MNTLTRRSMLAGLVVCATSSVSAQSQQQVLKIVYPFPAGGSADSIVRAIAEELQKNLGRPVIVENKTGAGGRIGAQAVKEAPADGSVLLFAAATQFTLQPHLVADLGYDPFTDFVPVSRVVKFDQALAVSGTLQARSIGELVAWLKANPDQAVFGSPGLGTGAHFAGLEFGRAAGIAMRHVPYRGTPAALPDLVAGRLPVYLASTAELVEQHRSGGVRILATAGAERWAAFPGIPTLKESGVNIEAPGWFAFYLRSDVSGTVAERLEKEIAAAAALPAVQAKIKALGFGATDTASRNLAAVQRAEFEAWAAVVKTNGFKPE